MQSLNFFLRMSLQKSNGIAYNNQKKKHRDYHSIAYEKFGNHRRFFLGLGLQDVLDISAVTIKCKDILYSSNDRVLFQVQTLILTDYTNKWSSVDFSNVIAEQNTVNTSEIPYNSQHIQQICSSFSRRVLKTDCNVFLLLTLVFVEQQLCLSVYWCFLFKQLNKQP